MKELLICLQILILLCYLLTISSVISILKCNARIVSNYGFKSTLLSHIFFVSHFLILKFIYIPFQFIELHICFLPSKFTSVFHFSCSTTPHYNLVIESFRRFSGCVDYTSVFLMLVHVKQLHMICFSAIYFYPVSNVYY